MVAHTVSSRNSYSHYILLVMKLDNSWNMMRKYSDIMTLAKPLKSYRRHTYRSYTGHVTVEAPLLVDHLCVMLHLSVLGADSNSAS
ncbi:hypothetical protein BVRB_9g218910 isoform B [Beta vulgaris subsp. vulgaris]|nr:hypothetical protein BVRB_9g218910 isoform B [Beta vulgaris subsp. vulgaris]